MESKTPIYPIEPWNITETGFNMEHNYRNETTFALSNGYIGTRGTFEESYDFSIDQGLEGNFINGFYESEEIRYGEANYGSPLHSQSLLNLPNLKGIRLTVDGEEFDLRKGKIKDYCRTLHMRDAVLNRELIWELPDQKMVKLCIRRFVSFQWKNIMEQQYLVTPLNFTGEIVLTSSLQADVENHTRKTNPIVDYGPFGRKLEPVTMVGSGDLLYYEGMTQNSKLSVGCGCVHKLLSKNQFQIKTDVRTLDSYVQFQVTVQEGETVILEKYICYTSDLDMPKADLWNFTIKKLEEAKETGFDRALKQQKEKMQEYWDRADVEIEGDDALQQGLRFNLFHIMQSAGRDGKTGMGAKGLSGEGYEGHYFWDTEMYVLPVFVYTAPELAKKLLDYRYHTLNQARARARVLGHDKGALFPWRTINGEEASTYYPLGTAQYHINGDISYALWLYITVTGDMEYLREKGAELFVETARVWADVGSFAPCKDNQYCICSVTGPDEYNVLVDNNFYTNLMARENLRDAVWAVQYLKEKEPCAYQKLKERLAFEEDEIKYWQSIIDHMYFPYDEERQIYPLDDGFMMRKPWDESKIPPEKRAWLYENYHPLFIMRHRMSKQADSILGMYLYGNHFTKEEIRRNYDFYQEVTLHHSSLSTCIFGIVACSIGYYDTAYTYFTQSARMDLDDYHNNFYAGIHAANMAGTWQAIVNGFAGLRTYDGILRFDPYLPNQWEGYSFHLNYRQSHLKVRITGNGMQVTLLDGGPVEFMAGEVPYLLEEGELTIETI